MNQFSDSMPYESRVDSKKKTRSWFFAVGKVHEQWTEWREKEREISLSRSFTEIFFLRERNVKWVICDTPVLKISAVRSARVSSPNDAAN